MVPADIFLLRETLLFHLFNILKETFCLCNWKLLCSSILAMPLVPFPGYVPDARYILHFSGYAPVLPWLSPDARYIFLATAL
jgi:hypothetical protein